MASAQDRIIELEEELRNTKYNKATESHIGEIKAKIAKFRREMAKPKGTGSGGGFDVRKCGDSSVVFIGFPSVGKSTLLNQLTNAQSEVAAYEFTTLTVIPGVLNYKGARIQLLDVPGVISGAAQGRGRGREALSVARNCDLLLLILDVFQAKTQLEVILHELEAMAIRPNQKKPDLVITPKLRGRKVGQSSASCASSRRARSSWRQAACQYACAADRRPLSRLLSSICPPTSVRSLSPPLATTSRGRTPF